MGDGVTFASNSSADVNPILGVKSIAYLEPGYDNYVYLSWNYSQINWYSNNDSKRQLNDSY